jgi:branched-chain amino acid transport system substrate-binding protein
MSDSKDDSTETTDASRRALLRGSRRSALAGAGLYGAAPFYGPWKHNRAWAQTAQKKPLVIGLTMDASGLYAASGGEERLGAMMAIKEFNDKGGVLGRRIEAIHMDTETTPATGSRVAERMIARNEAAFLIGAVHSGVANAISQVAQKYGAIFLNTNSSSPTEAGKDCHRVKFVWDGNGANFSQCHRQERDASTSGRNWVLLTNDYVWGHSTSKATRAVVEANGGRMVDELLVPQNTRDFSRLPAEAAADSSRTPWPRPWAATTSRHCASRWCSSRCTRALPGSTTSRTGPMCTAWGRTRSLACSAPPGITGWSCRA